MLGDTAQVAEPMAMAHCQTRDRMATYAPYRMVTYEGGPGYSLPNSIPAAAVEYESIVMKSLAAGECCVVLPHAAVTVPCRKGQLAQLFTIHTVLGFAATSSITLSRVQARPIWMAFSAVRSCALRHRIFLPSAATETTGARMPA